MPISEEHQYGIGLYSPTETTSPWVHYRCDICKACVRMARLDARRPKTWATVQINCAIANTVTTICGKCLSECPTLLALAETFYADR